MQNYGNKNCKLNNNLKCSRKCCDCCCKPTAPDVDSFFNFYKGMCKEGFGKVCITKPAISTNTVVLTGPTGATGPMGATGPTGPSGMADEIVIGEIRASYDGTAAVFERKNGRQHILDFIIPKGDKGEKGEKGDKGETGEKGNCGSADKIAVAGVEILDNGDVPQVVDNVSSGTHNLMFKIPRGPAGEKGDKGEQGPIGLTGAAEKIVIAGVQTVDNKDEAQVEDNFVDLTHNLTFKIPRGETGLKGEQGEVGQTGPRGEKGDTGEAEKIAIASVEAVDQGSSAEVVDNFQNLTHNLSFKIPRGATGLPGETGMKGEQGDPGPMGETGPRGNAMIFGRFSTQFLENTATYVDINRTNFPYNYEDLMPKDVVVTYNGVLGSILDVDKGNNRITLRPVANISGPKGDKGEPGEPGPKGDTGPTGPELIKTSLVLGYNNDPQGFPVEGMQIATGGRIPFVRLETNYGNIAKLNQDNSIQFNETGVYSVNFVTNAYIKPAGAQFDPATDFVVVGFREENSEKVFAAANCWATEHAECISGQGVFVVEDISKKYELVNLQKRDIYVNAVDITKTITNSYFASVLATLVFQKLSEKTD